MSDTAERTAGVTGPPPEASRGQAAGGNGFLRTLRHGLGAFLRQREATVLTVVVALGIYFTIDSPDFLTHPNLANMLSGYAAPYIILTIGEVLLLICGEIDLSVGLRVHHGAVPDVLPDHRRRVPGHPGHHRLAWSSACSWASSTGSSS